MDSQQLNRVEMEMSQWRSKEERFSKLFSVSLSSNRSLLKEKLQDYERIAAKYKETQNPDERFALRILKQESRQIERQLYPNLLIRLLRRLLVIPVREQVVLRQDIRQAAHNSQSLHHQVQRAGFAGLSSQLEEQVRKGQQQFTLPVSYYVNEKERIDHQLSFAKDQSGLYQFTGYKATLSNEAKSVENREHFFNVMPGDVVDAKQAYNLLSGRSINKGDKWVQLDLNDRDIQGNYRIKEFHGAYGYDLPKVLQQLQLKELDDDFKGNRLRDALHQGGRVSVSFLKDGNEQRYYIEANPQFKTVNIYDEHNKKISIAAATGTKTMEASKLAHKVSETQEESLEKRKGMRVS